MINLVAAFCFAVTGHVRWELVPVMAVAAFAGGTAGGRFARRVNATVLRPSRISAANSANVAALVRLMQAEGSQACRSPPETMGRACVRARAMVSAFSFQARVPLSSNA